MDINVGLCIVSVVRDCNEEVYQTPPESLQNARDRRICINKPMCYNTF